MKSLSIGIIGSGQVAETAHIINYQKKGHNIVAICDINYEQAQKVSKKFNILKTYTDYKEMLQKEKFDAISVCVPNKFHSEIVIDVLGAGINVLCEKPPALTYEEALLMEKASKSSGKILTFNFHYRFSNEVEVLKKIISSNELGEIYFSSVKALRRRGIPGWGVFTNKEIQGGGPLIDIGIHMLDIALYLMDFPEVDYLCGSTYQKIGNKVGAGLMGVWDPKKFTVEDSAFGFLKFKNGASLKIETAFALNMKEKKEMNVLLFGDKAGASVFPLEIYSEHNNQITNKTFPFVEEANLYEKSLNNFINSCLGVEKPIVKIEEAVKLQEIINKIYESAEINGSIKFK